MPYLILCFAIFQVSLLGGDVEWALPTSLNVDGPIRPPRFDKGFLLVVNSRPAENAPLARRFGADGTSLPIRLQFPDATDLKVYAGAILDVQGRVVLTGLASSSDNRPAPFLAILDNEGRLHNVFRTNPYLMMHVAVAPDGAIWGLGYDCERGAGLPTAEVVHRYREDGTVLGRYIPRREIEARGGPRSHPALASTYGVAALDTSRDRVGAFLPEASLWIEFDLGGALIAKTPVLSPTPAVAGSEEFFQGVYMTGDNRVFAVSRSGPKTRLLEMDRETRSWRVHRTPHRRTFLSCGTDGDSLIACPFEAGEKPEPITVPALQSASP